LHEYGDQQLKVNGFQLRLMLQSQKCDILLLTTLVDSSF